MLLLGPRLGNLGPLGTLSLLGALILGGHLLTEDPGCFFSVSLALFFPLSPVLFGPPPGIFQVLVLFLGPPGLLLRVPPGVFQGPLLSWGPRSLTAARVSGLPVITGSCGCWRGIPLDTRPSCLSVIPGSRGPWGGTLAPSRQGRGALGGVPSVFLAPCLLGYGLVQAFWPRTGEVWMRGSRSGQSLSMWLPIALHMTQTTRHALAVCPRLSHVKQDRFPL